MKILKILGVILVLVAGAFIGYTNFYQKEIVIIDGVKANKAINLKSDVQVVQKLQQGNIDLKEIQIQFGTYSAQKKSKTGVLGVSLLENNVVIEKWYVHAEKLVDNAYQSFVLENPIKLDSLNRYSLKISYHYNGDDNVIAIWTNKDTKYGSFKYGDKILDGSICYRLGYLE